MKVLITGVTGLVGRQLAGMLRREGHTVVGTSRTRHAPELGIFRWDALREPFPREALAGVEGVVHLVGEPIAGFWTPGKKRRIRDSRVGGTRHLVAALKGTGFSGVLVGASAVGFYGHRGEEVLTEKSPPGGGFLAGVVREWEEAYREAPGRVVWLRLGVVISPEGGALPRLLGLVRWGGGMAWRGHWLSWIALEDAARAFRFALLHELEGPVLAVAPQPVLWCEVLKILGRTAHRPTLCLPRPPWLPEFLREFLASQRCVPHRLKESGFVWLYPELEQAISESGKPSRAAVRDTGKSQN